jgi:hypothetical protein
VVVPVHIVNAIHALWRLRPPGPRNILSAPQFVCLREACRLNYSDSTLNDAFGLGLATALRNLGLPCEMTERNAHLSLAPDTAAQLLDEAFRRHEIRVLHFCPLDDADELRDVTCGPFCIRNFSPTEMRQIVNGDRLRRTSPLWNFDAEKFSEFKWLTVEEQLSARDGTDQRGIPPLFFDLTKDFGAIDPHRLKFKASVQTALFALLLAPWEDWVGHPEVNWKPFRVPWVYSVSDDIFVRASAPPSPDSLSWDTTIVTYPNGEDEEVERPFRFPLNEDASRMADWINNDHWQKVAKAVHSELFSTPIAHFLCAPSLPMALTNSWHISPQLKQPSGWRSITNLAPGQKFVVKILAQRLASRHAHKLCCNQPKQVKRSSSCSTVAARSFTGELCRKFRAETE